MKYALGLLLIVVSMGLSAQENETLLSFFYLKNGEVYATDSFQESEDFYTFIEIRLGQIVLPKNKVQKIIPLIKNQYVRLELRDNTVYRGKLVEFSDDVITLESDIAGIVKFDRNSVVGITPSIDRTTISNPNRTRYFFAPSALPLEKGEGYYQNAYLLANSVNFGLSKNFSFGGGVVIPLFFYITPKLSFPLGKNVYAGVGLIGGSTFLPDAFLAGALPYGLITIGTSDNNVTVGSGLGALWVEEEWFSTKYPVSTVNAMFRISNRFQFITENWIAPFEERTEVYYITGQDIDGNDIYGYRFEYDDELVLALSAGLRVVAGDNASFDIAPVFIRVPNTTLVLPYLDFVYKF